MKSDVMFISRQRNESSCWSLVEANVLANVLAASVCRCEKKLNRLTGEMVQTRDVDDFPSKLHFEFWR